jgi:hypothetical protein
MEAATSRQVLFPRRHVDTRAAGRHLSRPALALRTAHAVIAVGMTGAIAYLWWCTLTGRRGPLLGLAVKALLTEGALVATNHGECPLGPLQERLGDPVPLFELVLTPRAARRAVPVLGVVTAVPLLVLAGRGIAVDERSET